MVLSLPERHRCASFTTSTTAVILLSEVRAWLDWICLRPARSGQRIVYISHHATRALVSSRIRFYPPRCVAFRGFLAESDYATGPRLQKKIHPSLAFTSSRSRSHLPPPAPKSSPPQDPAAASQLQHSTHNVFHLQTNFSANAIP